MKAIKFIHCADLHLDSPFVGLKSMPDELYRQMKQSTFQSLTNIVDLAIDTGVDFVIIAGDLYDGQDRSIRAQLFLKRELERLERKNIPVFIVHGNHDHLGGKWTKVEMPENVHIFPDHPEMKRYTAKNGAKIHLYGYSYPKKHVYERVIDQYEKIEGADYHIGILHGHDTVDDSHYRYAPFRLADLMEKEFDYWALGHIHKTTILHENPYIIYPGNTQGRHPKEQGRKGCYIVEMDPYRSTVQFRETAPVIWETAELSGGDRLKSFDMLLEQLVRLKEREREKGRHVIVDILIDRHLVDSSLEEIVESDDLLHILRESEESEDFFVWVRSISFKESVFHLISDEGNEFFNEMYKTIRQLKDLHIPLSPLFQHREARKFLQPLTKEEEREIKGKVETLFSRYFSVGKE